MIKKNWYIVLTKEKCEKKVSTILTKKRIKNFCPVHYRQISQLSRVKYIYEPLFPSYVFAYMREDQIDSVKEVINVVNFVYWKNKLAIVQYDEIKEIREFVSAHQNIKLERSMISLNTKASVVDRPAYSIDGNVVKIKNRLIKVNLPSLGYTMVGSYGGSKTKKEKKADFDILIS